MFSNNWQGIFVVINMNKNPQGGAKSGIGAPSCNLLEYIMVENI